MLWLLRLLLLWLSLLLLLLHEFLLPLSKGGQTFLFNFLLLRTGQNRRCINRRCIDRRCIRWSTNRSLDDRSTRGRHVLKTSLQSLGLLKSRGGGGGQLNTSLSLSTLHESRKVLLVELRLIAHSAPVNIVGVFIRAVYAVIYHYLYTFLISGAELGGIIFCRAIWSQYYDTTFEVTRLYEVTKECVCCAPLQSSDATLI